MTRADLVTARLQQRRWLGARLGKAGDRLALQEKPTWSEPVERVASSAPVTVEAWWRSTQYLDLYRAATLDGLRSRLRARA